MQAIAILRHAIRQVTGNLGAALRISAAPMVLQYALILLIGRLALPDKAALQQAIRDGNGPVAALALMVLIALFCGVWLAVAWHRFVLLNEATKGPVPALNLDRMAAYLARSLLLGLILLAAEFIGAIPVLLISGMFDVIARPLAALVALLGSIALILLVAALLLRLSVMLPAAAIGADSSFRTAWEKTRGRERDLLVLALLVVTGLILMTLPQVLFEGLGLSIFAIAWQLAATWAATLVLLSLFTTLYGHIVEQRALL